MYHFPNYTIPAILQMAPRTPPSFFKILLDPSAPHLPLPADFVSKRLKNEIPKDPIILSASGGHLWRLKIRNFGESYCFTESWSDVVKDIQLNFGDFLVFHLVDKFNFKLLIYSPNGCKKVLPPKIKVEDDGGSVDNDVVDLAVHDDDDDDDELVEEDEEDGDGDGDDDDDDEDEEGEEDDDEEEEDDDDDDDDCVDGVHCINDDDGEEEEDDDDDDDDGGIDGDDPYFMSTISATNKNILRLPAKFVELAGIEGETIKLKNDDGEERELGLRMETLSHSIRYYISAGWPAFRRDNHLSEGDICLFKFIASEGILCLAKVTIKRRPARQPQPSGESPATRVVSRKRGRAVEIPASEPVNNKRGRPRRSREIPATGVVNRRSGRLRSSHEIPATEVVSRRSGRLRSSHEIPATEVVTKKRGRRTPLREIPATEVVNRKSGRRRSSHEIPATETGRRRRGRPQPPVEIPGAGAVKRKRGRSAREHGGDVDLKSDDERMEKRPRGRPYKRPRGRPRQR